MDKRCLKEFRIWKAMKSRCYSPSQTKGYYKKFGITVCDRWLHDFEQFMKDMGPIPGDDYSIERIDVHANYCPENCRWIPMRDQPKNRSNSIFITHDGKTMCLKDWSRVLNINYSTLIKRIHRGIPFETAIKGGTT